MQSESFLGCPNVGSRVESSRGRPHNDSTRTGPNHRRSWQLSPGRIAWIGRCTLDEEEGRCAGHDRPDDHPVSSSYGSPARDQPPGTDGALSYQPPARIIVPHRFVCHARHAPCVWSMARSAWCCPTSAGRELPPYTVGVPNAIPWIISAQPRWTVWLRILRSRQPQRCRRSRTHTRLAF
jgi:hypothetical protein